MAEKHNDLSDATKIESSRSGFDRFEDDSVDSAELAKVIESHITLERNANDVAKKLREASEYVERQLQFETSWYGQRMTWLLLSQSFLFFVFSTIVINQTPNHAVGKPEFPEIRFKQFIEARYPVYILIWLLPLVGFVQASVTFVSLRAAKQVDRRLSKLRAVYHLLIRKYDPYLAAFPRLGTDDRTHSVRSTYSWGGRASSVIPPTLMAAWFWAITSLIISSAPGTCWGYVLKTVGAIFVICSLIREFMLIVKHVLEGGERRFPWLDVDNTRFSLTPAAVTAIWLSVLFLLILAAICS